MLLLLLLLMARSRLQKKVVVDGEDAVEKKSYARDEGTKKIALLVVVDGEDA